MSDNYNIKTNSAPGPTPIGRLETEVGYGKPIKPANEGSIRLHLVRQERKASKKVYRKITRKLNGFLISLEGTQAKVGFLDDGKVIEYFVPAEFMTANKITQTSQPFVMTEYQDRSVDGLTTGKEFRPIAPAESGLSKTVDLDERQLKLRKAILSSKGLESKD